jgi:CheY-like chemotaxis protein
MPTVLVVDDDDAVRGAVSEALGIAGYQVIAVTTTTEALRELDAGHAIDLAIIDVKMPPGHPHGFAFARMARYRQPTLRFLFVSGSAEAMDPNVLEHEDRLGPVLLKPVRITELIGAARAALAVTSEGSSISLNGHSDWSPCPLMSADHWRQRAANARAQANELEDREARQSLLEAAENFDQLAEQADVRRKTIGPTQATP